MKNIIYFIIFVVLLAVLIFIGRNKLEAYFFNSGNSYYNAKIYAQAIDSFKNALKINQKNVSTHYMLACAYRENNMLQRAADEYEKVIKMDPRFTKAYCALSNIYWNKQMYEEALAKLKEAEAFDQNNQEIKALAEKISFEFAAGSLEKSINAFLSQDKETAYGLLNKIVLAKPDFAYAHYTLATFYYNDHKFDAAEKELNETLRLDAQFWPALKLLGDIYFAKGLFESAVGKYKDALAFNEQDASIQNDLGIALVQLERYSEAIVHLQRALKLNPTNNIRYNLASAYKDREMFKEAELAYKELALLQDDYPNLYNDLGDIYAHLGKTKEADISYQREITNDQTKLLTGPNNIETLNNLAYAYCGIKDYTKAKGLIEEILAINPKYRQGYLTLAKIQQNSGNSEAAVITLNKAKELSAGANFIEQDIAVISDNLKARNSASFLAVDTVYLNNGREIKGKIIEEDQERIVMEVKFGKSIGNLIFYRNMIKKINKGNEEIRK